MIFHTFRTPTEYSKSMCGAALEPLELAFTTLELALKADEEADSVLKPCRFCLNFPPADNPVILPPRHN